MTTVGFGRRHRKAAASHLASNSSLISFRTLTVPYLCTRCLYLCFGGPSGCVSLRRRCPRPSLIWVGDDEVRPVFTSTNTKLHELTAKWHHTPHHPALNSATHPLPEPKSHDSHVILLGHGNTSIPAALLNGGCFAIHNLPHGRNRHRASQAGNDAITIPFSDGLKTR